MERDVQRVIFLLWLDAELRIEAGESRRRSSTFGRWSTPAARSATIPGTPAQMSRAGGFGRAIPCLETALAQGEAASTSLAALQSLLEDEARQPARMIALRGERAIIDDLVRANPRGQARPIGDSRFLRLSLLGKAFSNPHQHSREPGYSLFAFHTRVDGGRPVARGRADRRDEGAQRRMGASRRMQWGFLESRAPAHRTAAVRQDRPASPTWLGINDAQIRTAIAALAAERFRSIKERWPESLDQLVPKYICRRAPRPVRDALRSSSSSCPTACSSIRSDLTAKDDGGKIDPKLRVRDGADTGFRLWNVDRRRQPIPRASQLTRHRARRRSLAPPTIRWVSRAVVRCAVDSVVKRTKSAMVSPPLNRMKSAPSPLTRLSSRE